MSSPEDREKKRKRMARKKKEKMKPKKTVKPEKSTDKLDVRELSHADLVKLIQRKEDLE